MVKTLIFGLVVSSLILSCGSKVAEENEALKEQIAALTKENEGLRSAGPLRETSVNEYQRTLEEIDYNLRTIELYLMQASGTGSGRGIPVKERIDGRLAVIQKLIRNSNLKIKSLDENLDELRKKANNKSSEVLALERVMKNAAQVLMTKEEELYQVKAELGMDETNLEKTYEEQLAITFELYKIVNRAYFLKGTREELRSLGLLDQTGIFIGIAKTKTLSASAIDSVFSQIEKDKKGSFLFDEDRIKVITPHPEDSYSIKRTPSRNVLTVKDKKAFWKNGNYLIVQTD